MKRKKGVTIIEAVIAMTLVFIAMAAGITTSFASLQSRNRINDRFLATSTANDIIEIYKVSNDDFSQNLIKVYEDIDESISGKIIVNRENMKFEINDNGVNKKIIVCYDINNAEIYRCEYEKGG